MHPDKGPIGQAIARVGKVVRGSILGEPASAKTIARQKLRAEVLGKLQELGPPGYYAQDEATAMQYQKELGEYIESLREGLYDPIERAQNAENERTKRAQNLLDEGLDILERENPEAAELFKLLRKEIEGDANLAETFDFEDNALVLVELENGDTRYIPRNIYETLRSRGHKIKAAPRPVMPSADQ
jgi:hypothetical protein